MAIPVSIVAVVFVVLGFWDDQRDAFIYLLLFLLVYTIFFPAFQIRKVKNISLEFDQKDLDVSSIYKETFSANAQFIFNKIRLGILQSEKWQLIECNQEAGILKYVNNGWMQIVVIKVEEMHPGETKVSAKSLANFTIPGNHKVRAHMENIDKIKVILNT